MHSLLCVYIVLVRRWITYIHTLAIDCFIKTLLNGSYWYWYRYSYRQIRI